MGQPKIMTDPKAAAERLADCLMRDAFREHHGPRAGQIVGFERGRLIAWMEPFLEAFAKEVREERDEYWSEGHITVVSRTREAERQTIAAWHKEREGEARHDSAIAAQLGRRMQGDQLWGRADAHSESARAVLSGDAKPKDKDTAKDNSERKVSNGKKHDVR